MKWKFLTPFLLAFGYAVAIEEPILPKKEAFSEARQQLGYFSAGVGPLPIPLPVFAGGYRVQRGHHGADLSIQASTIVSLTQFKANLLYHYYFKPSLASQFYVGGGIGPSYVFGSGHQTGTLSPEFVFGKQYRNESNDLRFFQMQVSFPTWVWSCKDRFSGGHNELLKFPLVIISYGIGF